MVCAADQKLFAVPTSGGGSFIHVVLSLRFALPPWGGGIVIEVCLANWGCGGGGYCH